MALVQRSLSSSTWGVYQQVWEAMLSTAGVSQLDLEPCLLFFVGDSFGRGVSASVMSRKLSALAFWFKKQGFFDVTKSFMVRQAMKGFRKGFNDSGF